MISPKSQATTARNLILAMSVDCDGGELIPILFRGGDQTTKIFHMKICYVVNYQSAHAECLNHVYLCAGSPSSAEHLGALHFACSRMACAL